VPYYHLHNDIERLRHQVGGLEQLLEVYEQTVEENAQHYRGLLEAGPDAMVIVNGRGEIVLVNAQTEKLFGYRREELLGEVVEALVPERYRQAHVGQRQQFFAMPRVRQMGVCMELVGRRRDGSEFPADIMLGPLETAEGLFVSASIRDTTERKRMDEQLRRTSAELARSNGELQLFAATASHELDEPLRMVSSFVDMLAQNYKGQLDEKADRWIGFALDGVVRMKQLIHDLLELSRVSTRAKPFALTNLATVFASAVANLQPTVQESGALVSCGPLPTILADATQMTQLLQNLLGNALKFRSQQRLEIHVAAESQQGQWLFSVRDNGIGIDPQFTERIFVIFQRLHTRQEYPGTGLGLALCKKIVERHGGRIWVESQPGQGATFYFTIPETQEYEDAAKHPEQTG